MHFTKIRAIFNINGASNRVYEAIDPTEVVSKKSFALKVSASKDNIDLESEIKIHSRLQHRYICKYLDSNTEEGWLAMKLYKQSLKDIIDRGRISETEARIYFEQILIGVEYLHDKGIIHRDLKPDNIFISNKDIVKIGDFGLATHQQIVTNKHQIGTPDYMAPEIIREEPYTKVVDIWSLGATLYHMLTAKYPFDPVDFYTAEKVFRNVTGGRYHIPDYLSNDVVDLLQRMMCLNPEHRITLEQIKLHSWMNDC